MNSFKHMGPKKTKKCLLRNRCVHLLNYQGKIMNLFGPRLVQKWSFSYWFNGHTDHKWSVPLLVEWHQHIFFVGLIAKCIGLKSDYFSYGFNGHYIIVLLGLMDMVFKTCHFSYYKCIGVKPSRHHPSIHHTNIGIHQKMNYKK